MARKAKYDWGKSRDGRYQKFETRLNLKGTFDDDNTSPHSDSKFIDLAQCLSVVNRKLVRQGHVFKVKNLQLWSEDDSPTSFVKIGVLPRTWPMFNAYKKARSLWNQYNLEAFGDIGASNLPKYYDFKVLMSAVHANNQGSSEQMTPVDFDDNAAPLGEWVYSKMHNSNSSSDEFQIHMLGGHTVASYAVSSDDTVTDGSLTSIGAILAYQQSRGLIPANADAASLEGQSYDNLRAGPWGSLLNLDNDQMSDIIEDHVDDNDAPPYDREEYPGTRQNMPNEMCVWDGRLSQKTTQGTTGAHTVRAFEAPLGLLRIEVDSTADLDDLVVYATMDTEIIGAC